MKPLVVVGDALLDRDLDGRVQRLAPDAPVPVVDDIHGAARPGGAGLAALLVAAQGRPVTLVTAVGEDDAGTELTRLLTDCGVTVVNLGLAGATAEKVRVLTGGRPLLRMDYGADSRVGPVTDEVAPALEHAAAVLVSDYGRGITSEPSVRHVLSALDPATPLVWDPHSRGAEPVGGVRVVTPNLAEASALTPHIDGDGIAATTARARALVRRWSAGGVVVTMGAGGALLVSGDGTPLMVPATTVTGGDPCGAGDRFATRVAEALADGAVLSESVVEAVQSAAAFVAAGGAGSVTPARSREIVLPGGTPDAGELIRRVQSAGGTAVATGGCFDLLHAGHVRMLQTARALGDCLVVCINSDDSVRRLKGPDRPVVAEADRMAVLAGLACVDAVVVFDEDTPEAVLDRLRPDIWAKGGDYAVADLPEAEIMRTWGGQAVVLPYLPGRSTSRLIRELTRHGG